MPYFFNRIALISLITACLPSYAAAQIIDVKSGAEISEQALARHLRTQDIVLLGELHDNPWHHSLRAALIPQFAAKDVSIIAEHLPAPAQVHFSGHTLADLEAAGFQSQAWAWPLHQPLFEALHQEGYTVFGGNLQKGSSRQWMLKGEAAMPDDLAVTYRRAPLSPQAQASLDQDLLDGHCGKLPEKYRQPMRMVQHATDASLANALLQHRPSVLVAGNGHVRKDYGVPQVLHAVTPQLKVTSVGFYEKSGDLKELLKSLSGRYDFVWLTDRADRSDPCDNFTLK